MTGRPGIGKTNSWQWINFVLDPFVFNPGAQGVGKYDGAEAKKIAISDDTPAYTGSIADGQYSTLLSLMSGNTASIKLHGRTSHNSFQMYVMFISNDYPQTLPENFKRRIKGVEVHLPYKDFWNISPGKYSCILIYNYFKQAYEAFQRNKYICYCASYRHISTVTCPEYDCPGDINCNEFNTICLQYEDVVTYPTGTDPFGLYKILTGLSSMECESSQSSVLSDITNT